MDAGGGDDARVGLGLSRVVRRGIRVEPVAELRIGIPEAALGEARLDRLQVEQHAGVVGAEPVEVAVRVPQRLRAPRPRRRPRWRRAGEGVLEVPGGVDVFQHVRDDDRARIRRRCSRFRRRRRAATCGGSRRRRTGTRRWRRRRRCHRSSRAVRRAAGSRSGRRGSCPSDPRPTLLMQLVDTAVGAREPPVRVRSECTTTASRSSGGQLAWTPAHLGVAEAVEGQCGLERVLAAGQDEPVRGPGRRSGRVPSSSCSSTSAWRSMISCPAGPSHGAAIQPTRFWPKSSSVLPDGEVQTAIGLISSWRVINGPTCSSRVARSNATERTSSRSVSGRRSRASMVWPVVQAVARAVRHSPGPAFVCGHRLRSTVRVRDHELADEAGLVAVVGFGASEAELASVPAVAEQHLDVHLPRLRRGESP